jgi:hypothetical protein
MRSSFAVPSTFVEMIWFDAFTFVGVCGVCGSGVFPQPATNSATVSKPARRNIILSIADSDASETFRGTLE